MYIFHWTTYENVNTEQHEQIELVGLIEPLHSSDSFVRYCFNWLDPRLIKKLSEQFNCSCNSWDVRWKINIFLGLLIVREESVYFPSDVSPENEQVIKQPPASMMWNHQNRFNDGISRTDRGDPRIFWRDVRRKSRIPISSVKHICRCVSKLNMRVHVCNDHHQSRHCIV